MESVRTWRNRTFATAGYGVCLAYAGRADSDRARCECLPGAYRGDARICHAPTGVVESAAAVAPHGCIYGDWTLYPRAASCRTDVCGVMSRPHAVAHLRYLSRRRLSNGAPIPDAL